MPSNKMIQYVTIEHEPPMYAVLVNGKYIGKVGGRGKHKNFYKEWHPIAAQGNKLPRQSLRRKAARILIAHAIGKGILPPEALPIP